MDINLLRESRSRDASIAFSVSELNNYIKNLLDTDRTLSSVTVRGEISNFTNHRSGHFYFSLKDAEGQVKSVMFRSSAAKLKFMPESGMKVIATGSVSAFVRDGTYQLYVTGLQPDGIGALYLAYEQLKEKLSSEGLFDQKFKQQIPRYPSKIGVITSATGAAIRDILNVTGRRYPLADICIYPALVQGAGAAQSLLRGIDYFDRSKSCDLIIIGRGGGSIEDLWAFNDEVLARRIFAATVPIISAVGHETDFTICDFVSDLRAPTPSAAAELSVPDMRDLLQKLDEMEERSCNAMSRYVERIKERLDLFTVQRLAEKIDFGILKSREALQSYYSKVKEIAEFKLLDVKSRLSMNAEKCNTMNPLAVLSRGYSIVEKNGEIIGSVNDASKGSSVSIIMRDGKILANVVDIAKE